MGHSIQHDAANPPAANPGRGHLLRILGAGFGIAVGVGNMIGTGILRTPGEVAGYLGSTWMFFVAWLLGGLYALLCSSSVTELATMLPRAGGWYVYARRAFGEHTGFVVGCCDWVVQSVSNAFLPWRWENLSVGCIRVCLNKQSGSESQLSSPSRC